MELERRAELVVARYDISCKLLRQLSQHRPHVPLTDEADQLGQRAIYVAGYISARAMDEFLRGPKKYPDDIKAADFVYPDELPELPGLGDAAKEMVHKRLAHITTSQPEMVLPVPHGWLRSLVLNMSEFVAALECSGHADRVSWFADTQLRWQQDETVNRAPYRPQEESPAAPLSFPWPLDG